MKNISRKMDKKIYLCLKDLNIPFSEIEPLSLNQIDKLMIKKFNSSHESCLEVK